MLISGAHWTEKWILIQEPSNKGQEINSSRYVYKAEVLPFLVWGRHLFGKISACF